VKSELLQSTENSGSVSVFVCSFLSTVYLF